MPTAKAENYSPSEVETMRKRYTECGNAVTKEAHAARKNVVRELAKELGKNPRSIISKMVSEKFYIKASATSGVTGEKPEKKDALAVRVVAAFGTEIIDGKECSLSADSLAKINKTDLAILFHRFNSEVLEEAEQA